MHKTPTLSPLPCQADDDAREARAARDEASGSYDFEPASPTEWDNVETIALAEGLDYNALLREVEEGVSLVAPDRLWRRGAKLLELDSTGMVSEVTTDQLSATIARCVSMPRPPAKPYGPAEGAKPVPMRAIRDLKADPLRWGSRQLQAVRNAPWMLDDGSITSETGYYAGTWFQWDHAPLLPEAMGDERMWEVLTQLTDFRFQDESDRLHLLAAFMSAVVHRPGECSPLYLFNAVEFSSGKSTAASAMGILRTGRVPSVNGKMSSKDGGGTYDLQAVVRSQPDMVYFDNVERGTEFGSDDLDMLLTLQGQYQGRIVGSSDMGGGDPTLIEFVVTGNQVTPKGDTQRRCVVVNFARYTGNLDYDFLGWVKSNRNECLTALLRLQVLWHRAGRPGPSATLASFQDWARHVGGPLCLSYPRGADMWLAPSATPRPKTETEWSDLFEGEAWPRDEHDMHRPLRAGELRRVIMASDYYHLQELASGPVASLGKKLSALGDPRCQVLLPRGWRLHRIKCGNGFKHVPLKPGAPRPSGRNHPCVWPPAGGDDDPSTPSPEPSTRKVVDSPLPHLAVLAGLRGGSGGQNLSSTATSTVDMAGSTSHNGGGVEGVEVDSGLEFVSRFDSEDPAPPNLHTLHPFPDSEVMTSLSSMEGAVEGDRSSSTPSTVPSATPFLCAEVPQDDPAIEEIDAIVQRGLPVHLERFEAAYADATSAERGAMKRIAAQLHAERTGEGTGMRSMRQSKRHKTERVGKLERELERHTDRLRTMESYGPQVIAMLREGGGYRVHSRMKLEGTGRLRHIGPCLQNIAKGLGLRAAVVADHGWSMGVLDLVASHIRVAALCSGDEGLLADIDAGNVYKRSAHLWSPSGMSTAGGRKACKVAILALINGAGPGRLCEIITDAGFLCDEKRAADAASAWLQTYPKLSRWVALRKMDGGERSWTTPLGRRVNVPESKGAHVCLAWKLQSIEADVIRHALMNYEGPGEVVLTVHDEIVLHAPDADIEEAVETMKGCMERAMLTICGGPEGYTPVGVVSTEIRNTWGD